MIPLLVGTLIAVSALAFVLAPLFRETVASGARDGGAARTADDTALRGEAVDALREIEFDRETGKLSDSDYVELKATYTRQAVQAMRSESPSPVVSPPAAPLSAAAVADDEIERRIRAHRRPTAACDSCGPRPEPDAAYCSSCGRYLAGECARCGAGVSEPGARYCGGCGHQLARVPVTATV